MSKGNRRPKAPAGCFWREGVLYGRIQTGGADIKWSLRTDDPGVAKTRRAAERKRQVAIQRYGDHRVTFAEAMEGWGKWIADQIGPKTLTRYLSSLGTLQPYLEGLYQDEVDKALVKAVVKARRETPVVLPKRKHPTVASIATIKRDLTALSSVMDYCIDEEWRDDNPVISYLRPGGRRKSRLQERRDPIVLPDPAHIQMVVDHAPTMVAAMIGTALRTGARLDELKQGMRHHFDRGRRQLTVIGKRNKLRVIDLEDAGEDFGFEIISRLPVSLETRALFWHRREVKSRSKLGQQPARPYRELNFDRLVDEVAAQAQKQDQDFRPFRFHDLRHVHAVNWLKSGRSIYVLQQRLGHTSVKTTEMYLAYLTPEEKQIAMLGRSAAGSKTGTRGAV
jgi:integrase/recombinase XerD